MHTQTRYIDAFRDRLVHKTIKQGFQVARVAHETGVSKALLGGWVLNHVKDALYEFEQSDLKKTISALEADKSRLNRENELLKKMLAFVHLLNKTQ